MNSVKLKNEIAKNASYSLTNPNNNINNNNSTSSAISDSNNNNNNNINKYNDKLRHESKKSIFDAQSSVSSTSSAFDIFQHFDPTNDTNKIADDTTTTRAKLLSIQTENTLSESKLKFKQQINDNQSNNDKNEKKEEKKDGNSSDILNSNIRKEAYIDKEINKLFEKLKIINKNLDIGSIRIERELMTKLAELQSRFLVEASLPTTIPSPTNNIDDNDDEENNNNKQIQINKENNRLISQIQLHHNICNRMCWELHSKKKYIQKSSIDEIIGLAINTLKATLEKQILNNEEKVKWVRKIAEKKIESSRIASYKQLDSQLILTKELLNNQHHHLINEKYTQMKKLVDTYSSNIDQHRKDFHALKIKSDALCNSQLRMKEKIKALQIELQHYKSEAGEKAGAHTAAQSQAEKQIEKISMLSKQLNETFLQLKKIQKIIKTKDIEINKLRHVIREREEELATVKYNLQQYEIKNEKLNKDCTNTKQKLHILQEQNKRIRTELEATQVQHRAECDLRALLQEQMDEMKSDFDLYQSKVESLEKKIHTLQTENQFKDAEKFRLENETRAHKKKVGEMQLAMIKAIKSQKTAKLKCDKLTKEKKMNKNHIQQLEIENNNFKKEIINLKENSKEMNILSDSSKIHSNINSNVSSIKNIMESGGEHPNSPPTKITAETKTDTVEIDDDDEYTKKKAAQGDETAKYELLEKSLKKEKEIKNKKDAEEKAQAAAAEQKKKEDKEKEEANEDSDATVSIDDNDGDNLSQSSNDSEMNLLSKQIEEDLRNHLENELREKIRSEFLHTHEGNLRQEIEKQMATKYHKRFKRKLEEELEKSSRNDSEWKDLLNAEKEKVKNLTKDLVQRDEKIINMRCTTNDKDAATAELALLIREKDMLLSELTLLSRAQKNEIKKNQIHIEKLTASNLATAAAAYARDEIIMTNQQHQTKNQNQNTITISEANTTGISDDNDFRNEYFPPNINNNKKRATTADPRRRKLASARRKKANQKVNFNLSLKSPSSNVNYNYNKHKRIQSAQRFRPPKNFPNTHSFLERNLTPHQRHIRQHNNQYNHNSSTIHKRPGTANATYSSNNRQTGGVIYVGPESVPHHSTHGNRAPSVNVEMTLNQNNNRPTTAPIGYHGSGRDNSNNNQLQNRQNNNINLQQYSKKPKKHIRTLLKEQFLNAPLTNAAIVNENLYQNELKNRNTSKKLSIEASSALEEKEQFKIDKLIERRKSMRISKKLSNVSSLSKSSISRKQSNRSTDKIIPRSQQKQQQRHKQRHEPSFGYNSNKNNINNNIKPIVMFGGAGIQALRERKETREKNIMTTKTRPHSSHHRFKIRKGSQNNNNK